MGCRQLIVLSFALACVSFSDPRLDGAGVPARRGVGVQKSTAAEANLAAAVAERKPSSWSPQLLSRLQRKQAQEALPPLSWKFPEDPVNPVKELPVEFRRQLPVESDRLAVRCGQKKVYVEVSQDLTGLGSLIEPDDLTLGGCPATEVDEEAHVLVFESDLHGCGSSLVMTDDVFIYAFVLLYKPPVLGRGLITRSQRAAIGVECHYKRSSNRYSLTDTMNLEVSVMQTDHVPLKVLADYCVAAKKPGFTSEPKQEFIKNHGCVYCDRKASPQLSGWPIQPLFISCYVKAIPASSPNTIEDKACSFTEGRWRAVRGNDQFCSCCGSTCGMRKARDVDSADRVAPTGCLLWIGYLFLSGFMFNAGAVDHPAAVWASVCIEITLAPS
uniref:Zona pellucida sperm-binding protein 3 n=1 Tax=Salarias fasciatus TaxID=181472 RepID=A0A672IDC9_SALFA